jgi:hypothetical protein
MRFRFFAACLQWWNYAFVIAKKGGTLSPDAVNRKLNPAHVPAAHSTTRIFRNTATLNTM